MMAPVVLLVGVGVVGLPFAMRMAQARWGLVVCDFDRVEPGNLAKQFFDQAHVGMPKAQACAEIVRRHNPAADVRVLDADIRSIGVGFCIDEVTLVCAAVDNRAAEMYAARIAYLARRAFVRLATRGETRVVDVTIVPAPRTVGDPCGVCSYTPADVLAANLRQSCLSEVEANADAGALTYAEHGTLAAALAADAVLRDEIAPARRIRFTGGETPEVSTTRLAEHGSCITCIPPWTHAPAPWIRWVQPRSKVTMAALLEAACDSLHATAAEIAVELDAPLCRERFCEACERPAGPAFRTYPAQRATCEACGEVLRQAAVPPATRWIASQLAPLGDYSLAQLRAPLGLGLRFVRGTGQSFNVYVGTEPWGNHGRGAES